MAGGPAIDSGDSVGLGGQGGTGRFLMPQIAQELGLLELESAGASNGQAGFVRQRVDYTRLLPGSPYRFGLLCWFPLMDQGLEQRQLAEWPSASTEGNRPTFKWSTENLRSFGPRRREGVSRMEDANNTFDLGNDVFLSRPAQGTVAFWIRFTGVDSVDFLAMRFATTDDGLLFGISADGRLQLLYSQATTIVVYTVTEGTAVLDGQWHHLAYTGDGTAGGGSWRFYIDGRQLGSVDLVGTNQGHWYADILLDVTNASFVDQTSIAAFHAMAVSDLGSWDRVLNHSEIWTLANDPDVIYARTQRRPILVDRYRVQPTGIPTAEAVGSPTVVGQLVLAPSSITSAEAFSTGALLHQQIRGTGVASAEAIGTAKLNQQLITVGVTSAEAVGTAKLNQQVVVGAGVTSAEAFGTPTLLLSIAVTGIASDEAFGVALLNQQIRALGIATAEAFGVAKLNQQILLAAGIASAEAFGTAIVSTASAGQTLSPSGIATAEAFGLAQLNQQIRSLAITSAEQFGTPVLNMRVLPIAIPTAEAFGSAFLQQQIRALGIATGEAFSVPLLLQSQIVQPFGIASVEAFGLARLHQAIVAAGIASAEAFGLPLLVDVVLDAAISDFTGERLSVITITGERRVQVTLQGERRWLQLFAGERRVLIPLSGERRLSIDLDGDKT